MKRFKILLLNTGYCVGVNGSRSQYVRYCYRYLFCSRRIQRQVIHDIDSLIAKENPDLCCFIELHKESNILRRFNQLQALLDKEYRFYHMANKYGERGILSRAPVFRQNTNGFMAKKELFFRRHYFRSGRKKLLYEIILENDIHLFMAHFSLKKEVRERQFVQLKNLIQGKKRIIICGDFNIFHGYEELKPLLETGNLEVMNSSDQKTFPSCHPKRYFDLFICSKDIKITNFKVLRHICVSDHLPVIMEFAVRKRVKHY
ncbi:endonuclease/exonuclease/phosphatase family protein [Candidatus Peregrinibacteria bacterium]|nr:endonuclease/exonuclease/phosphatase family protein [Candidatus Peregrinibacteria bacterium]